MFQIKINRNIVGLTNCRLCCRWRVCEAGNWIHSSQTHTEKAQGYRRWHQSKEAVETRGQRMGTVLQWRWPQWLWRQHEWPLPLSVFVPLFAHRFIFLLDFNFRYNLVNFWWNLNKRTQNSVHVTVSTWQNKKKRLFFPPQLPSSH